MNPKVIAYYLPQFHRTKENDEWWGTGFTEWTNVALARPLFKGHYQPKIPTELGFYDLRYPDVRMAQAEMAKKAGISAFCYWHYWFGKGKKLLNMPFEEVVKLGEPDLPFCLAWANHSWYKKLWKASDGYKAVPEGSELLMEQLYPGIADMDAHFYDLLDAFRDKRYFKICGKLVFCVFSPLGMPDFKDFKARWQQLAGENNLPGFYFIGICDQPEMLNKIRQEGYDAINLTTHHQAFPFSNNYDTKLKKFIKILRNKYSIKPNIVEYSSAIELMKNDLFYEDKVYPTIIPNWDHTPRSGNFGTCFNNCSPALFSKHVNYLLNTIKDKSEEDQVLFLKSWNEWGEGNYMEPDIKYGDGMLRTLHDCLNSIYN